MAQWINWGNGHDGSPNSISGTINTYATCTGTAGQTVLTTTLSASDGDQILIHQSQHATAAGTWEIVKVSSDAGATLNLYTALVNSYSTGAQCILIPQYTGGTISGAITGTAWNGSVGGIIALMSSGDLINTGSITPPAGFRGGTGTPINDRQTGHRGENEVSNPQDQNHNANGVGGGAGETDGGSRSGGGGGGYATSGTDGQTVGGQGGHGGTTIGLANLTTAFFGGGGGSGGTDSNEQAQTAGAGSGCVFIFAKSFTTSSGIIPCTGRTPANCNQAGGSGGGAGGFCLIKCQTAVLGTNKITAAGGTGGVSSVTGDGGAGGVGRIHIDYYSSYTGTTTPTIDATQDLTLNVPAPSGFFNFL